MPFATTHGDQVTGFGTGIGSGSGIGVGNGIAAGTGTGTGLGTGNGSERQTVDGSVMTTPSSSKPEDKNKSKDKDKYKYNSSGLADSALSVITAAHNITRSLETINRVNGTNLENPVIAPNDPIIPFLALLTDEAVEYRRQNQVIPVSDDLDESENCHTVTVHPGNPRYPGFDPDADDGNLEGSGHKHTPREHTPRGGCALLVVMNFYFTMDILAGLRQYIPGVVHEGEMISHHDIVKIMKAFLRIPEGAFSDLDLNLFYAHLWWAFTKSNHWPSELKTLDDVIKWYPVIQKQCDAYYAKVPVGKKPHDLGAGSPKERDEEPASEEEDEEQWRRKQMVDQAQNTKKVEVDDEEF